MKQKIQTHRIAIAALSAAIVLPIAPVFAQDAPAAAPPPVVIIAPPPPVVTAPPVAAPAPAPVARVASPPAPAARPVRTATRAPAPVRHVTSAPARATAAAPAPAPAPVAAPAPEAVAPVAPPVAAPAPAEPVAIPVETADTAQGRPMMLWLAAGGLLVLAALAFLFLRSRRRADDEVYEETVYEAPVAAEPIVAAPEPGFVRPTPVVAAAAAPVVAAESRPNEVEVGESVQADVDALAAESAPVAGRPWLEFMMRPVRAGTSQDDAIVQFELTVGNTGTVDARDVRISTWMVAAGQGTDMERSLIAPADATVSNVDIDAGDGTRVDGEISLSKSGLGDEAVMPVVVADARYRLPDGSEGRTHASFAVGMPDGDGIAPFPIDRASGLLENVEARLHGEPERV